MEVTYFGHSTVQIQHKDTTLLIDPFLEPFDVDPKEIEPDYVLVTHGHQDHIANVKDFSDSTLVAPFEICNYFSEMDSTPMNIGGSVSCGSVQVTMVTATHSSSFADGSYAGNPTGFIIEGDATIYVSGDTGVHSDMKLFGERWDIDLAVLCIGGTFTMDAKGATHALRLLRCNEALGVHYNTFPPISINTADAKDVFALDDKTLHLLDVGQSMEV